MLINLTTWFIATLFTIALVYLTFPILRSDRWSLNLATAIFLWIFYVTLMMLTAGLIGWLDPLRILLISSGGLLILIFVPQMRERLVEFPDVMRDSWFNLAHVWNSLPVWVRRLCAAALALSLVRFGFLILALPPFVWDALTYHLTNVAEWVQSGSIRVFDTAVTRIYSPANFEAFAAWFVLFLQHDAIIEVAGLPAYLLSLISVYSIGRTLNLSREGTLIGMLAYATTPALLIAVTGTKNDPHMTGYFLYTLALIMHIIKNPAGEGANQVGQILLIAMALLLALGTKTYLLHLLPGLFLIALIGIGSGTGLRRWRPLLLKIRNELKRSSVSAKLVMLVLLMAGGCLGFYWNARNLIVAGNPFFPYSVTVSGVEVAEGVEQTIPFGFDRLISNLELFVWKFGDRQGRISPDLPDTTGWGWFAYTLGIATLVWGLLKRRDIRSIFLGFGLSFLVVFMSNRPSPWNMRYMIWVPALFSWSFAAFWDQIKVDSVAKKISVVLTMVFMANNFISVWNYGRFSPEEFQHMLAMPLRERGSADLLRGMPAEYENALTLVDPDSTLGYHVNGNGFIYPLYRPDYSQDVTYVPINPEDTCEQIARSMVASGTRYLVVAPVHADDEVMIKLHHCAEEADVIQERSISLYVLRD